MRRSCLSSLLALGLLAAPLAAPAVTAAAATPTAVVQHVGTATASGTAAAPRTAAARTAAAKAAKARAAKAAAAKAAAAKAAAAKAAAAKAAAAKAGAAPAPATTRSGAYAFLHVDAGAPVRWNPCADVPWTFNPAGAPAGGLAAVQSAFAELSRRTGLTFAYQGTVTDAPTGTYLKQGWKQFRPLLVGWTSASSSDLLTGRTGSTVGVARVLWTGSYDDTGANRTQIASGVVAFNTATKAGTSGAGSWFTYALHELGHAVGLAHVEDASQVMNPVIGNAVTGFGTGDVAGLSKLGKGAGCLPDIR